jgi:hypothetical protein
MPETIVIGSVLRAWVIPETLGYVGAPALRRSITWRRSKRAHVSRPFMRSDTRSHTLAREGALCCAEVSANAHETFIRTPPAHVFASNAFSLSLG